MGMSCCSDSGGAGGISLLLLSCSVGALSFCAALMGPTSSDRSVIASMFLPDVPTTIVEVPTIWIRSHVQLIQMTIMFQ